MCLLSGSVLESGAYVTELSVQDVQQVYHVMALLESDAAAEVAAHGTDAQMAQLRALHDQLERKVRRRESFFATNEAFHMQIQAFANNRWRQQIVTDLRKVMELNRHHSLFKQGRIMESLNEHRALMEAIELRDVDAVRLLMQTHFKNGLAAAIA